MGTWFNDMRLSTTLVAVMKLLVDPGPQECGGISSGALNTGVHTMRTS